MVTLVVILALGRLRQEDGEFEASLGYILRTYLKKTKTKTKKSYILKCDLICFYLKFFSNRLNDFDFRVPHLTVEG
jgi:hypothetical protein